MDFLFFKHRQFLLIEDSKVIVEIDLKGLRKYHS